MLGFAVKLGDERMHHAARSCSALGALAFAALAGFGSGAQGEPRIVTFNLGGCDTEPVAISARGVVVGNSYSDGDFCSAFVRLHDGTFEDFHAVAVGINRKGEITGNVQNGDAFFRKADGSLTYFSLHMDGHKRESTAAAAINSSGTIAGTYAYLLKGGPPRQGGQLGFLRTRDGTITMFGCPNSTGAGPIAGLNDLGATVSRTGSSRQAVCIHNPDGTSTVFDAGGNTFATGINDAGSVIGWVDLQDGQKGFVRAPDGTITLFDGYPHSINAAGTITGEYWNPYIQGFVRTADGAMTLFDVDGAVYTRPKSINDKGVITGEYGGANSYQGFIRFP